MRIAQRRLKVAPGSPASDAARPEPHDWYLPVSPRAYFAYVNFWHAVTLLVYAALGARVVWLGRDGPLWQTLLALGLVLIQAGTYVRLYVFVKRCRSGSTPSTSALAWRPGGYTSSSFRRSPTTS